MKNNTTKLQKFEGFMSSLTRGRITKPPYIIPPKFRDFWGEYEIVHYARFGKGSNV